MTGFYMFCSKFKRNKIVKVNKDCHIIDVKRDLFQDDRTLGQMHYTEKGCDRVYFSETLEDTVRAKGVKVYGKTAIPDNDKDTLYNLDIHTSGRFGEVVVVYTDKVEHKHWTEYVLEKDSISFSTTFNKQENLIEDFQVLGRVARVEEESFSIQFETLDVEQKESLWQRLVHESQLEEGN